MNTMHAIKSYRPKQAAELLGIGTATLWRWIKERPDFPQPIRLSARCTVIPGDQLIAWRDAQRLNVPQKPAKLQSADSRCSRGSVEREIVAALIKGASTQTQLNTILGRNCSSAVARLLKQGRLIGFDDINPETGDGRHAVCRHYALWDGTTKTEAP